jgi:hypothetical protein
MQLPQLLAESQPATLHPPSVKKAVSHQINMPRRVAPQRMKIEDEEEDEHDFLVRPHAASGFTSDEKGSGTRTKDVDDS